jgi:REP element-mobilizing transposase RayT
MGRPQRFIPPRSLVEVTCRTLHGRFLLRPSRDLNEIAIGVIARAARLYRVQVVAFVILSNHAHYLLIPDDAEQLALFMNYVNGNLAREASRLHRWSEKFWGRRYRAIVVSDEEAAQIGRLRYLLAQGSKEGLVRSPRDWPGASSTEALLTGCQLTGAWFDRTTASKAKSTKKRKKKSRYENAKLENLALAPLPAWAGLSPAELRERATDLVRGIERETRQRLAGAGRSPLGRRRVLRQDPHEAALESPSSPAPMFHAVSRRARQQLMAAYRDFCAAFRRAARQAAWGEAGVWASFPEGSFPPRLPFRPHRLEVLASA